MESEPDKPPGSPESSGDRLNPNDLAFDRPCRPIAELLETPDFPRSALGEFVDIGGYTGVVTDIVNQSLKVKSPEGGTKSFNANGLRRIYGPRPALPESALPEISREPPPPPPAPSRSRSEARRAPEEPVSAPKPAAIEPDFSKPVKNIAELVSHPEYPDCVLGEHVEISGYTGVVVQIINRSLKVRSPAEITRSYNADALRKIYSGQS